MHFIFDSRPWLVAFLLSTGACGSNNAPKANASWPANSAGSRDAGSLPNQSTSPKGTSDAGTPDVPPPADANFETRRKSAGVIGSEGWDSASDFVAPANGTLTGFHYDDACPTWPTPCILQDTTVYASGGGSARWDIYGNTSDDAEGNWFQTFGQTFAENSTFYVQFAFRPDPVWTTLDWTATGEPNAGTAPKLIILHGVDDTGEPVACDAVDIVIHNHDALDLPTAYTACGMYGVYTAADGLTYNEGGNTLLLQQGFTEPAPFTGYQCAYANPKPTGDCFNFTADAWHTLYMKIHVGNWGQPNSTIEAWAAVYGQQLRKFINVSGYTIGPSSSGVTGFAALTLTEFMTDKLASVAHPTAHAWYDELIVSTKPIPAPSGQTP